MRAIVVATASSCCKRISTPQVTQPAFMGTTKANDTFAKQSWLIGIHHLMSAGEKGMLSFGGDAGTDHGLSAVNTHAWVQPDENRSTEQDPQDNSENQGLNCSPPFQQQQYQHLSGDRPAPSFGSEKANKGSGEQGMENQVRAALTSIV